MILQQDRENIVNNQTTYGTSYDISSACKRAATLCLSIVSTTANASLELCTTSHHGVCKVVTTTKDVAYFSIN